MYPQLRLRIFCPISVTLCALKLFIFIKCSILHSKYVVEEFNLNLALVIWELLQLDRRIWCNYISSQRICLLFWTQRLTGEVDQLKAEKEMLESKMSEYTFEGSSCSGRSDQEWTSLQNRLKVCQIGSSDWSINWSSLLFIVYINIWQWWTNNTWDNDLMTIVY